METVGNLVMIIVMAIVCGRERGYRAQTDRVSEKGCWWWWLVREQETFSVINVMEFDSGMERAKKAHMQCIVALRKFWCAPSMTKTEP